MIRFLDGPAAGKVLNLQRHPLFLRAVQDKQTAQWDACDQLGDSPLNRERPFAYIRCGEESMHLNARDATGKRCSRTVAVTTYRLIDGPQPFDETMRDNGKWQAWCQEQESLSVGGK